jgi:hypothetical protein
MGKPVLIFRVSLGEAFLAIFNNTFPVDSELDCIDYKFTIKIKNKFPLKFEMKDNLSRETITFQELSSWFK